VHLSFQIDLLKNCLDEQVWAYRLTKPITKEFEGFFSSFGTLKYPLGDSFSFIKLETKDFLLTGNIGLCELKLTIKHGAHSSYIKETFEAALLNYLKKEVKDGDKDI